MVELLDEERTVSLQNCAIVHSWTIGAFFSLTTSAAFVINYGASCYVYKCRFEPERGLVMLSPLRSESDQNNVRRQPS